MMEAKSRTPIRSSDSMGDIEIDINWKFLFDDNIYENKKQFWL